jgi:choice-of-anchor A domain-containing protein
MANTGAAGTGSGSTESNPNGATATQGSGGDSSIGGMTGQSGSATGADGSGANGTGANGSGANGSGAMGAGGDSTSGGYPTVDISGGQPSSGGQGTTIDVTGGQGTSIDVTGGRGTSIDVTGGQGTSIDVTGGQGTSIDLTGGRGTTIDQFGGTGNTTDTTGGVGTPPPPPDSGTPPGCIPTWFGKQINVLVLHDAFMGGADTRGGLWVGGNLSATGGYDVGGDLPPDPTCTRYDLAVGGNITLGGSLVMHNGAAAYGGTLNASSVAGAACGIYHNPADMPNFTQIATDVKGNTAYFAGLTPNGTVSGTTFNGANASCKIVVFNTTLCTFDYNVVINIPANGTAIINSTCINPSFSSGPPQLIMGGVARPICTGQQGTGGSCDRVLYNFPNATTVTVNQTVQGSILAPYAKFIGQGANVDGEVVVDSMDNSGGVEFHAWFFEGCLDTTTC